MTAQTSQPVRTAPRPLATAPEVAEYLRLDTQRLSQLRSQGGGPAYVKIGRDVRYNWRDVDAWLDACRLEATR